MFQRPFLFLTGLLAATAAPLASAQTTLFGVDEFGPGLLVFNPSTGAVVDASRTLNFGGTAISQSQGLARHPKTSVLYALVTDASNVQSLVTVDEASAECTVVSATTGDFYCDIAFSSQGTLYGIAGNVGGNAATAPGTLYRFNEDAGSFVSLSALANSGNGEHAIAWDPENGKLLHNSGGDSGNASGVWEYVNPLTGAPESALPGSPSGSDPHNVVLAMLSIGSGKFQALLLL